MKNKISLLVVFFNFLFLTNMLWAQEKNNSVHLDGSIVNYIGIDDFNTESFDGYYKFPLSPGIELTYLRQIFPKLELGAGLNFQKVHVASNADISYDYILRFRYNEISIPLLLKKIFLLKKHSNLYFTLGVYNGKQINIISEYPVSVGWQNWDDIKTIAGYSGDHFFSDIYFDTGYTKLYTWGELAIAPFFKYRMNQTWLNTYQERFYWGVKFNYSFKF